MKKIMLLLILSLFITGCVESNDSTQAEFSDNTIDVCDTTIEPSDYIDDGYFNIERYTESIEEICDESFHDRYEEEMEELDEVIEWCYKKKGYDSMKECIGENY